MHNDIRICIRLPGDEYKRWKIQAEKRGLTVSEMIRNATNGEKDSVESTIVCVVKCKKCIRSGGVCSDCTSVTVKQ